MLVLIDESGCSGFKLGKGSTSHFVVAMVIFDDFKEAERTSAIIADARKRLRVKPEFKFSKSSDAVRDQFFSAVTNCRFIARALVVNKSKIYSTHLRGDADSFYNFFVQNLIKHDGDILVDANVKIDGSGDREFRRALQSYLRREGSAGKVKKVTFVDSKGDNLIQLADMVCGAIARGYSEVRPDDRWRRMLGRRVDDVWMFK